jgi:general secretion pathway protein G
MGSPGEGSVMIQRKEQNQQNRQRRGFTLMEMLVVVAIIVALAGMGSFYFIGVMNDSKKNTARAQLQTLSQACEAYKVDDPKGEWPANLDVLYTGAGNGKKYLKNEDATIDPAGNKYVYDASGTHNGGTQPDISTTIQGEVIGNWSRAEQKRQQGK